MTLPHGTGTRAFPCLGTDISGTRSTLQVPEASLTATVAGEGA